MAPKTIPWALAVLAGCTSPTPPDPPTPASASASPLSSVGSGSEFASRKGADRDAAASPSDGAPRASSEPVPDGSVDASSPDAGIRWEVLDEAAWPHLVGRWIGDAHGDAIPGGPLGGKIVAGGARFEFVKGRPGSKTPWNLTFWLPTSGHLSSTKISGGCGFYESGVAFCKGYGLPAGARAQETRINVLRGPGFGVIRVSVTDLFDPVVLRMSLP